MAVAMAAGITGVAVVANITAGMVEDIMVAVANITAGMVEDIMVANIMVADITEADIMVANIMAEGTKMPLNIALNTTNLKIIASNRGNIY